MKIPDRSQFLKDIVFLTMRDMSQHVQHDHILELELKNRGLRVSQIPWEDLSDGGQDLFLVRTTWNYTKYLTNFLERLVQVEDRLWNPLELIRWNANKKYLKELAAKGLPIIPLRTASDQAGLLRAVDELGGPEFVVKPFIGAGSDGLIRFDRGNLPDLTEEVIVQKFCPEIQKGEVSMIYFSGSFAYAVKKVPVAGDIRVQEEYGGLISAYVPTSEDFKVADEVVKHIPGEWLYARVDLVPGVGLMEIECIEPSLYFGFSNGSASLMADTIIRKLDGLG